MALVLRMAKRHISFYNNKEYTSVFGGINLKSRCTNRDCESVRSMNGLVIIKCPDMDTCVYQEAVYNLPCPSCGTVLSPMQFSGVVFVRCEARISSGEKSELVRASQEETLLCELDYLGPEIRICISKCESEKAVPPSDSSQSYMFPAKGVNLVATCRRIDCLALKNNRGLVMVKVGMIGSGVFQELIKFRNCPSCNQELDVDSFNTITFLGCRAEVEIGGRIEKLDATSFPKNLKVDVSGLRVIIHLNRDSVTSPPTSPEKESTVRDLSPRAPGPDCMKAALLKGFEVYDNLLRKGYTGKELTPGNFDLQALRSLVAGKERSEKLKRSISIEASSNPSGMDPGINFMADCPTRDCGSVVIPSGHIVSCKFKEAIRGMTCPKCHQALAHTRFTGVGFLLCKASVQICEEKSVFEAGRTPKICKVQSKEVDMEICILEHETQILGMEYLRACSGLNVVVSCHNTECLAYLENSGQVNIPAPSVDNCLLRDFADGIICPSCATAMDYSQVKAITFIRCSGEVYIGDQHEEFKAAGDQKANFLIFPDGPEVIINILSKNQEKSDLPTIGRKYTKVCDGLNFSAFCENPDCLAVQENAGFVNVKRDEQFIQIGNFLPNRCNYSVEVQILYCPSCGSHIDPNTVRGVALVRCKGTIDIAGKSQNFEAKLNDFVRFELDYSDPRTFIEYEVVGLLLYGRGLNFLARCPNKSCSSKNNPILKDSFFLNIGIVMGFKVNEEMLKNRNCSFCNHPISLQNIIRLTFNDCTAVTRTKGKETHYLVGPSMTLSIALEFSEDIEVDILPIIAQDISLMLLDDNPFFTVNLGLNVQAICSKHDCQAKRMHGGRVCIGFPEKNNFQLRELFSTISCPGCDTLLSSLTLVCLSFVGCKANLQRGNKNFLIKADSDEVINFKSSFIGDDMTIKVLSLEEDFPEKREQDISRGSVYSHSSICHGLNFQASCINPDCLSVLSYQFVNIMSGHLLDFDYRLAVQSLVCSCCATPIPPEEVDGVTVFCCTGEVKIGDRLIKFDYTGNKLTRINIPNDGSNVWIKIEHRTYDVITNPVFAYSSVPFRALCKGLNFRCFCKNPSCNTFKHSEGIVHVQRNAAFIEAGSYPPNVCSYHEEISYLKCPDCSNPLPRYFVWGILLNGCSGTILRNGSPPEKFCTPRGKVVLYALDRDDASARIELCV